MARKKVDEPKIKVGNIADVSGEVNIAAGDIYKRFTAEQVSVLIKQISTTFQPKRFDGRCPYKGLDVFEEEDADLFFGREKLVDDLVSRVKESRTVFITGPSGSGKSSLVRAGLIHALKQGAIKNSDRWLYETIKPGRDPLETLALAFSRLKSPELSKYFRENFDQPNILHECSESALSNSKDQRLVLFIDQFEEVFTQVGKDKAEIFINILTNAATIENGRVSILFATRSDFVSNCATYPQLNELLNQQFIQIGAMQPDELVSAIAQPALRVGLRIDPDLIAQIINDMQSEPGALPLLQFALKDLFDSQQAKGGMIALTLNDYLQRGGIHKSLERHADTAFAKLSEKEQELARPIFGGLIEIGRGTQDTRRTALFDELIPASTKAEDVEAIVQKLADARLITTDEQAGKDTVTISHEKLIDAWPWLKKLVNENRDAIALQNEIASDAKEWEKHRRDSSYLYTGARLANARERLETKRLMLGTMAQEFVKKSDVRERRGQLLLAGGISTVMALLLLAVIVFSRQSTTNKQLADKNNEIANVAQTAQANAQEQARTARVGELAAQVVTLREKQPVLSLLLGIETYRSQSNLRTRSVLIDNLNLNPQVLQYLSGQSYILEEVAFSPDGKILASAGFNQAITLWDIQTGQQIGILQSGPPSIIWSIAFSPDGKILASGNDDNTITLWDMESLRAIDPPLKGHSNYVRSVAFSPDGTLLASSSADLTIRLWDVQTLQPIGNPLTGHSDVIYDIAFSPDGEMLISGSVDKTVRLWDLKTFQPIGSPMMGHTDVVKSVAISLDGKTVASGSVDETIILWDVKSQKMIGRPLTEHSAEVRCVVFSPDGKTLASGSADKTIILWDVATRSPIDQPFTGHTERVVSVAFSPDGEKLASAGDDGLTILWDAKPHLSMGEYLGGHNNSVRSLAFSPDGLMLASASNDQTIIIWDSQSHQAIGQPIIAYQERVASIAFSPDGKTLASGYADGALVFWNVQTRSVIGAPLLGHSRNITSIAYSPDGKILASASLDSTIILWDTQTYRPIDKLLVTDTGIAWNVAFSPDGKTLASGGADGVITLWDVVTRKPRAERLAGHSSGVNSVVYSPDGQILASAASDNKIILWDMQTLPVNGMPLGGHLSSVNSVAFSPNQDLLASGSTDNTIILWELSSHLPLGEPIVGDFDSVTSMVFSPLGDQLASGSVDGTLILWDLDPESWIRATCERAGRNYSRSEWIQYFNEEAYHSTCPQWTPGK